jgi:hypothetical protein
VAFRIFSLALAMFFVLSEPTPPSWTRARLNDLKIGDDDAIEEKALRPKDLVQWANITLISQWLSNTLYDRFVLRCFCWQAAYPDDGSLQMALVIYNPAGGDRTAKQFVEDHVLPLLKANDIPVARIVETEHAGHAGAVAFEFVDSTVSGPLDIIVASGDGTIHEIVSTIALAPSYKNRSPATPAQVNLVLVPCGTANALYSSLFLPKPNDDPVQYGLQGIHAFIKKAKRVPLTLAITDILAPPTGKGSALVREKTTVSAVVTSTALHASILHDSEALRAEIPSMERFKVAAHQNIARWYSACAKLLPSKSTGVVEIWNPFEEKFVPHAESDEDDPYVDIDGPFTYFLSAVNVDRLEPAFQITPLVTTEPRTGAFLDIVVVRPYRDASLSGLEAEEEKEIFAKKSGEVLRAAYQSGNHINLRYNSTGKVVSDGEGELVVEYFRCGGWEWIPVRPLIFHFIRNNSLSLQDVQDEKAHLLCNDGFINTIPKGGRAKTMAAAPSGESGFIVYV